MPYRHVVEISDEDLKTIEKTILQLCKDEGYIITPNLTHIALTELFNDFVDQLVNADALTDFICEGGLDDVLERTDDDE
jgi:hypothetical protein